ncbi:MAG: LysM peptidoglycan-binding domain-containing protein [Luteolibacter sp.]
MKPSLLFTALSLVLATSPAFAKSELETLRALCAEQERQIHHLEDENMKLRDGRESSSPRIHSDLKPTPAPLAKAEAAADAGATYIVKSGDSIDKIARKVGTSATQLVKANGLKPTSMIHPGQKLKVPGKASAAPTPVASEPAPVRSASTKSHTVRPGETFFSIGKKHGISTAALVAANPTVKASALRPGQVLRLGEGAPSTALISAPTSQIKASSSVEKAPAPVTKAPDVRPYTAPAAPAAPVAAVEAPAPMPTPAPAPAAVEEEVETAEAPAENKFRAVTIDGEMTYGAFAAKHGTDADRLNALNGLDLTTATVLAKGSELYVPARP